MPPTPLAPLSPTPILVLLVGTSVVAGRTVSRGDVDSGRCFMSFQTTSVLAAAGRGRRG